MKLFDRNRDGILQREEIPAKARDRLLDIMDSNNDEALDQSEMEAGRKQIDKFLESGPRTKKRP